MVNRRESLSGGIEIGDLFYPFRNGFEVFQRSTLHPINPEAQYYSPQRDFEGIGRVRVELIEFFTALEPHEETIYVPTSVKIRPVIIFDRKPETLDYTCTIQVGEDNFASQNFIVNPSFRRAIFREWVDDSGILREPVVATPEDITFMAAWIE